MMHWVFAPLALLVAVLATASADEDGVCFPQLDIANLPTVPRTSLNIFTGLSFECSGEVAAWEFYASRAGRFFVGVWRQEDDQYYLMGKNRIDVAQTGAQTVFVEKARRLKVDAGYVLGIHYGELVDNDGIVPVTATGAVSSDYLDVDMMENGLHLQTAVSISESTATGSRVPALKPVMSPQNIRLQAGNAPGEGRLSFFLDGEWGTVCASAADVSAFPAVACRELGYDHVAEVKNANDTYVGNGHGLVAFEEPDCASSDNFLSDCTSSGSDCDHNDDVFIKCENNVRLTGSGADSGIAEFYNAGEWGTICSDDLTKSGWPTAFCQALGYHHAKEVMYVSELPIGASSTGSVSVQQPTCDPSTSYTFSDCLPTSATTACGHEKDVFISCEHEVRLKDGAYSNEGRAEFYKDGAWGTICDSIYSKNTWPAVICQQMGYETVDSADPASLSASGAGTGSIAYQGPSCTPDTAADMEHCWYDGSECDHDNDVYVTCAEINDCASFPCKYGGECFDLVHDYRCECPAGYQGYNCEEEIDECATFPCVNGGTCIDGVDYFECECLPYYTGDMCEIVVLPEEAVMFEPYDVPGEGISAPTVDGQDFVGTAIAPEMSALKIKDCLTGNPEAVSLESADYAGYYLRHLEDTVYLEHESEARQSQTFKADTCFFPLVDMDHPAYFLFEAVNSPHHYLGHLADNSLAVFNSTLHTDVLFYIKSLDSANSVELFQGENYNGDKRTLAHEVANLASITFDDKISSFKIQGSFSWQFFTDPDFQGASVIAPPGDYSGTWVNQNLGENVISSLRPVEGYDVIVVWSEAEFQGEYLTIGDTENDIESRLFGETIGSLEVTGPCSWEVYSDVEFRGTFAVMAPGRYELDWLQTHLGATTVGSVRIIDPNLGFCAAGSGEQTLVGNSGTSHDVFVVREDDGSAWLRFGREAENWNKVGNPVTNFDEVLFTNTEKMILRDFDFVDFRVDSDLEFMMGAANSWHPSSIKVMDLGSFQVESLSLADGVNDHTHLTFNSEHDRLKCVTNGGTNVCGENNFPEADELSEPLVILSVDLQPRGPGAYETNGWGYNAYTFSGSKYYLYAKLSSCELEDACFSTEYGHSLVGNVVTVPGEDGSPDFFYFGNFGDDTQSCEGACRDELQCVGFTHYTLDFADAAFRGQCYGVGWQYKDNMASEEGCASGIVEPCETLVPMWMEYDVWTKNTSGCLCSFDDARFDCACCYEGGCQCGEKDKYQCVRCGYQDDHCGIPSYREMTNEYVFEGTDLVVEDEGEHFNVPDLCVTKCTFAVDGAGSTATSVAAHLTDWNDVKRLSCIVNTEESEDAFQEVTTYSEPAAGVSISGIHLFGFNGLGATRSLELEFNPLGCPPEEIDERYVGCFAGVGYTQALTTSHMTREVCISHCLDLGYSIAQLQQGLKCTCDRYLPREGEAFDCDMGCSGNPDEMCGGLEAMNVYLTNLTASSYYFVAPSGCDSIGATTLAHVSLQMMGDSCLALTGQGVAGGPVASCMTEWCTAPYVVPGGLYLAAPGSCGSRFRASVQLYVEGIDCIDMGGIPAYDQQQWGYCAVDMCEAISDEQEDIFVVLPMDACDEDYLLAYAKVETTVADCLAMGGSLPEGDDSIELVTCTVEICHINPDDVNENVYTLPSQGIVVPPETTMEYTVDEMCVIECEMEASSLDNITNIIATFSDSDGQTVGLECNVMVNAAGMGTKLGFSNPATGVKVSQVHIHSTNGLAMVEWLKLRIDPEGCNDVEDALILFADEYYGGEPEVLREDASDLGEYSNKASSFKVVGESMWQVFEHADFTGMSIVLGAGEYATAEILPFGDEQLSSVRRVENVDIAREDISDANGIVCFERRVEHNMVFGRLTQPRAENRPWVFYFGELGNDPDDCEQACREESGCAAWTIFLTSYQDAEWAGQCYGRGFHYDVDAPEENVVGGIVENCDKEDTITLFPEINLIGEPVTIIGNEQNMTVLQEYQSVMITGGDTWRLQLLTDFTIHTYYLQPGPYVQLFDLLPEGQLIGVAKLHPHTQFYEGTTLDTTALAPVATLQIEAMGGSNVEEIVEECNTTQVAEVTFVMDASSSIKNSNYKVQKQFVADVIASFKIGAESVRVAMLVYSRYPHYDITLGQFEDISNLTETVLDLTYYKGSTYTHTALSQMHREVLNATFTRQDVPRYCIVITDGESIYPDLTAEEAHLARDEGIYMTAIGIKNANYNELLAIAGDQSRVFNVTDWDELETIVDAIAETSCKAVQQANNQANVTIYEAVEVPGDDEQYFVVEDPEYVRVPVPLGMENGVISDRQIFASSALIGYEARHGRLNHPSGWITDPQGTSAEWLEIDLGRILPVHGVGCQGHAEMAAWVEGYKIAISLDAVTFTVLKDTNTSMDLVFEGNVDKSTVKHHCLHKIFGIPIEARVVRFYAVKWHVKIAMRCELFGYREAEDPDLLRGLEKDVWTRSPTGCPCFYDPSRTNCACCEDGGCQCSSSNKHQCVQCGYPHNCGNPSLRDMEKNVDGWTKHLSGCPCEFDPLRMDCACCQNYGCQCHEQNKNQCTNCGHPEHCGLKEWLFGPNPYCQPKVCPGTLVDTQESVAIE